MWDWDLETGAVVYSHQWKRMLGYGDDEIEPHVRAWERLLHPDDRAAAEALTDAVTRDKRPYEGEFRLRHKEGHYITVLTRGRILAEGDYATVSGNPEVREASMGVGHA